MAGLVQSTSELERRNDELQSENRKLLNQVVELKEENFALEMKVREQKKEHSKSNVATGELTRRNKDLTFRLDEARGAFQEAQDEIDTLHQELDLMRRKCSEQESQMNRIQEEANSTKISLLKNRICCCH